MSRLFFTLLIGAAMIAVTPVENAQAQSSVSSKQTIGALYYVAECYSDRSPDKAQQLLSTIPGSDDEFDVLDRDKDNLGVCLQNSIKDYGIMNLEFQPKLMRRALGAVMAKKRLLSDIKVASPATGTQPWFTEKVAALSANAKVDQSVLALHAFGHCVALSNWESSKALLLSYPDTQQESDAVLALTPSLGPCLSNGVTLTITKRNIREIIGEPVYHLLSAKAQSGASNG